jgi:hypothetical protein
LAAAPSRRPVGNVRISTKVASPITVSQARPALNSQGLLDECSTYTAPTNPNAINIGPKRL